MHKYKLVVFDLDGTLLDTSEGIISAVKYTIDVFGFSKLSDEQMRSFIGPPIQVSFSKIYGIEGEILQDIATVFRDRYKNVDLLKAVPYDGIYDCLDELKKAGYKLAVATYKREDYALTILKQFKFDEYFDVMHGADHYNRLTKSDIVELCIDESGIEDRSEAVLIGDTLNDEKGAKDAGIDFLGVSYGFGFTIKDASGSKYAFEFAQSPKMISRILLNQIN